MKTYDNTAMDELVEVIRQLRAKCPWDSVQTLESLKDGMSGETQEVLDAIDHVEEDHGDNLCEELGDVLMHLLLMSRIAEEQELFTFEDVIRGITWKMKFRHPKIYPPQDPSLQGLSWEELKLREKELRKNLRNSGKNELF